VYARESGSFTQPYRDPKIRSLCIVCNFYFEGTCVIEVTLPHDKSAEIRFQRIYISSISQDYYWVCGL
jgi:hypothetical protein